MVLVADARLLEAMCGDGVGGGGAPVRGLVTCPHPNLREAWYRQDPPLGLGGFAFSWIPRVIPGDMLPPPPLPTVPNKVPTSCPPPCLPQCPPQHQPQHPLWCPPQLP